MFSECFDLVFNLRLSLVSSAEKECLCVVNYKGSDFIIQVSLLLRF